VSVPDASIVPEVPDKVIIKPRSTNFNTLQKCEDRCRTRFECITAIFSHDSKTCVVIKDNTFDVFVHHVLHVVRSPDNITAIFKKVDGGKYILY
jgi:hypothetical protein